MKDWKGNTNSIYVTMGASNHSSKEREINDYYATEPKAVELLLEKESFSNVWEPACGEKHISNVLRKHGIEVKETDLINRTGDIECVDFLKFSEKWGGDIITNPPYKFATEFVQKSLEIIPENRKVAMFLKLQFLEGKARRELFRIHPPKNIYVA